MPWEKKAKAIIQTWFAGQEFGNALVDILSGKVNPSGKLPTTFPVRIEDTPAYKNYPGNDFIKVKDVLVKVDGNRQIRLKQESDQDVSVVIEDMEYRYNKLRK